jgi:hypothetical protein
VLLSLVVVIILLKPITIAAGVVLVLAVSGEEGEERVTSDTIWLLPSLFLLICVLSDVPVLVAVDKGTAWNC